MRYKIVQGDSRDVADLLPKFRGKVQTCVTSPPYYGLRDYGDERQIGLEQTPEEYVAELVRVFRGVRELLRDDGTLWLNLGDSYANDTKWGGSSSGKHARSLHGNTSIGRGKKTTGLKAKDLIGIPWRVAFALQADGWYLRQDIIWHKTNPMPESVVDRCTKAHEYIFLLSKQPRYYFDADAIKEPSVYLGPPKPGKQAQTAYTGLRPHAGQLGRGGDDGMRNKRSVWSVPPKSFKGAHFAVFPPGLVVPCIQAGSRNGSIVMDPFTGSGTTGYVSLLHGRHFVGVELNPKYIALATKRLSSVPRKLWA